MTTIYVDKSDYKCYVEPGDDRIEVETDFFNGKCAAFIEGYRFIPDGCEWTRGDGEVFRGQQVTPWVDYNMLAGFQKIFDELRKNT